MTMSVRLFDPCPPAELVEAIGEATLYCWYEGTQGLFAEGAAFMRDKIFAPLYAQKPDIPWVLYSLKGWDFKKKVDAMPVSPLCVKLKQIGLASLSATEFFQYCATVTSGDFFDYVNQTVPCKQWLIDLSKDQEKTGCKVADLFENKRSLLSCLYDCDVSNAYSQIQYIEGYFLIRRLVEKALLGNSKKVQIAFVLPNDEGKYYADYPQEIVKLLRLDFGSALRDVEISITFRCFQYGDSLIGSSKDKPSSHLRC